VHYLNGLQNSRESINSLGRETPWDECVREFDTERFADAMQEAARVRHLHSDAGLTALIAPMRPSIASAATSRAKPARPGI